jgi:hypothetical protein
MSEMIYLAIVAIECGIIGFYICYYVMNRELKKAQLEHFTDLIKYHNCLEENIKLRRQVKENS